MTTLFWIIAGLIAWFTVAVIVGILTSRIIRRRGHHYTRVCDEGHPEVERWSGCDGDECWYGHPITDRTRPSPNHSAARAHKRLTDDKPLNPHEAAAWKQLKDKLR